MQGKEALEQETLSKSSVGIDISKGHLDVHVLPAGQSLRVVNAREGIRQLKRWLAQFGEVGLVLLEATGKWHRPVYRSLAAAGLPVTVTNPYRVRMYARATGILAKTDRLDARVLAQFASVMSPPIREPAPKALEQLAELVTARYSAVAEETALKNQLSAANDSFLKRQLGRRIERLDRDIELLDKEILARIHADEELARRYEILTSIPGVGFVTAATLIAGLSELGGCDKKQIGMLAGLAPIADQSGQRDGVRVVWGGRAAIRRSLYLAALSAARYNPDMRAFFSRLKAAGKPPKVALIAIARKLAILANVLIAENRKWEKTSPHSA